MIEIIITLTIIMSLLSYIYSIQIKNIKLNRYNNELYNSIQVIKGLKEIIILNYKYEDIKEFYNKYSSSNLYINKENINMLALKNKDIYDIIVPFKKDNIPYVKVTLNKIEDDVIKIEFNINIKKVSKVKVVKMSLFKGEY